MQANYEGINKLEQQHCSTECDNKEFKIYALNDNRLLIVCSECGAVFETIKVEKKIDDSSIEPRDISNKEGKQA